MNFSSNSLSGGVIRLPQSFTDGCDEVNHLNVDNLHDQGIISRVYNFAKSCFQEACYFVSTCYVTIKESLIGAPSEYVVPSGENKNWKKGNKGLYVAIHGLNGRPNIWRNQLDLLQRQQPDFEIRLPYVPQKGNCSLDIAVEPIEAMIRDYISQHPGQPVCLMGVSNGARIAMKLEVRLRDTKTSIFISSVAGALSGTKQMDRMHTIGIATLLYKPVVVTDMLYQSAASENLLNSVRQLLPDEVERAYEFYVSPNDFQIKPYTGSLPTLKDKQVKHFIVPGENHSSIVTRVSPTQMQACMSWMQKHVIE